MSYATLSYPLVAINFSGNERDGIKALAEHPGMVHHVFRRVQHRDDFHRFDFIGWQNPATIESSAGTSLALRLRLLDRLFLVSKNRLKFLAVTEKLAAERT